MYSVYNSHNGNDRTNFQNQYIQMLFYCINSDLSLYS